MSHQRNIEHYRPPEVFVGYTAGMIDGEGTITVKPDHRTWRVEIFQSEQNGGYAFCRHMQAGWHFGRIYHRSYYVQRLGVHGSIWIWSISARQEVQWVLSLSLPHLVIKRARAEEALYSLEAHMRAVAARAELRHWGSWSPEENDFLRRHYMLLPWKEIAAQLERPIYTVKQQAARLELRRPYGRGFTPARGPRIAEAP